MPTTEAQAKFAQFLASKEIQAWLADFPETTGTKATYSSALYRYWNESLSKKYATLADWIATVKRQRKEGRNEDDPVLQTAWASEVKEYMKSRKGLGNRPMATASRELLGSTVKSFLRKWVDPELDYDFKIAYTVEEQRAKQNKKALSVEEMRKIYEACKTNRDKALVLVAANGVAPAEMLQFTGTWKEWFPESPSQLTAPFKVNLIRGKKSVPYHVTLFQDAVAALKALYEERAQKTGGRIDHLFVTDESTPYTRTAYEMLWKHLRERTGLSTTKAWERQRAHPHAVRHFFRTQGKTHRVSIDVLEYALGHSGDKYGYDRSEKEADWDKVVETELTKMTDVLNLKTGMAQAYYQSKEEELKAQIAKDTYRALIESGALKPEHLWNPDVLKVIAKKVGVTYVQLMMVRADGKRTEIPVDTVNSNLEKSSAFREIAQAIKLSPEVKEKYLEAFKVLRPSNETAKWENHTDYYLRTEIGSDDYMQALADGFKVIDSDGRMRILRKTKPETPELAELSGRQPEPTKA